MTPRIQFPRRLLLAPARAAERALTPGTHPAASFVVTLPIA